MNEETENRRRLILASLEDLVGSFLYYDRKDDEDLPRGAIEEAIALHEVTVEELIALFGEKLREGLA